MVPARSRVPLPWCKRWLLGVGASCWPLVAGGCASSGDEIYRPVLPAPVAAAVNETGPAHVVQAGYAKPDGPTKETLAAPKGSVPSPPAVLTMPGSHVDGVDAPAGHEVPISLDSVLRLAEEHNTQIALARERVHEGLSEQELAARGWIPQTSVGVDYWRHEGGIPLENGRLIHSSFGVLSPSLDIATSIDVREATYAAVDAERKVWQQRGELSRVSNETLLEAVNTYFDLLAARRGEQVAQQLEKDQQEALERAEKLAATDLSAQVLLEAVQTEADGRRLALARLHQQGDAAAQKLAYLLGMGPDALPVPVDPQPVPLDLVDVTPPTAELVARALQSGPGVQELQRLLAVIQDGFARLDSPLALLPKFTVALSEGAIGSGGVSTTWDNRLDVVVGARWNLNEYLNKRQAVEIATSRIRQAQLSLDDLKGKLTAGVREARDAVVSGREQMRAGAHMIDHAGKAYQLTLLRLQQRIPGSSPREVMEAIRAREQAHLAYLNAVTAYNKAEVRLLLLLGLSSCASESTKLGEPAAKEDQASGTH